jgi:hypothetical protein
MRTLSLFVCLACLFTACTPAQPKTGSLSGKVMHSGKPLPGGNMTFHPKSGPDAKIQIAADGTFEVTGLPVGEVTVSIETESIKQMAADMEKFGDMVKMPVMPKDPSAFKDKKDFTVMKMADKMKGIKYVAINEKYRDPAKSGLTVTILEGPQEKTFAVD